ncbi:MAG: hypothetical protein PHF57_07085 [Methanoregula sp.]|jgi:hypothetical protein|nr:hypothetical protein [Methanoregula sp.]
MEKRTMKYTMKKRTLAFIMITVVFGVVILTAGCVQDNSTGSATQTATATQTIQAAASLNPATVVQGQTPSSDNSAQIPPNSTMRKGNDTVPHGGNMTGTPPDGSMMRGNDTMPRGNMTGTPPSGTPPSGTPQAQPPQNS